VPGGDQGIVGGFDWRVGRQDRCLDEAPPERLAELALVVVAGGNADGRRIEADEQEPIAKGRQVSQRLDRPPVDLDRRPMGPGHRALDLDLGAYGRVSVHSD
jgi:hypothetical protein